MAEFRRVAHTKGWRVAIAGASNEALADYADLGFKSIYLGDEAVIRPSEFSLDGRPIRKVRQSVSRLQKSRLHRSRALDRRVQPLALREELHSVSEEWRGNWPERGFTMAMDALFRYPDTVLAVAIGPDGAVGGFLHLVPSPASEGYSLASMRRRRDTPNGLMEYLITETVAWGRSHGVTEISLNFAVFADFLRADEDAALWTRALRWALAEGRPALPARAAAQLQPQVLPPLAPPLLLLRALGRPPARRARLPPCRVAADAARALGQDAGSRRPVRRLARARARRARRTGGRSLRAQRRERRPGLEPLRLRRGASQRRARQRHHRRERREARASPGHAGRNGRLVADLPPRRDACTARATTSSS